MNELISTKRNDSDEIVVSGRDLHEFLGVKTAYKDWFPRMVDYGFVEGSDFCSFLSESTGGRPAADHHITIEMAKEISMLQRNEKGKQARQYFLKLEKMWNSPEETMKRALHFADQKVKELQMRVLMDKPKVLFADAVSSSKSTILIGDLAKLLKQNGLNTGQNRLFGQLRDDGYLIRKRGANFNSPTQKSMELGLFEIKETAITHADGHVTINKTTKVTGKGQQYFLNKYLDQSQLQLGE